MTLKIVGSYIGDFSVSYQKAYFDENLPQSSLLCPFGRNQ